MKNRLRENPEMGSRSFFVPEGFELFAGMVESRILTLENRVRYLEKIIDTKNSSWYKRLWWRIDGWPAWYKVGPRNKRPWHK